MKPNPGINTRIPKLTYSDPEIPGLRKWSEIGTPMYISELGLDAGSLTNGARTMVKFGRAGTKIITVNLILASLLIHCKILSRRLI